MTRETIHFTSLGCSKNLVDSEVMLGHLGLAGYQVVPQPQEAAVIIVNTCSFIEAAKQESIDTILELADFKEEGRCEALVVSGCMAQRYAHDLEKELPEVDLFIGTGEYHKITKLLSALREGTLTQKSFVEIPRFIHTEYDPRMQTTPSYMAWLKISEGCNRHCTFCIIPTLRGKLRSRTIESLVTEAQRLTAEGVREINLISQDFSDYGHDLAEEKPILKLLQNLEQKVDAQWMRIFYFYPDDLSEEVMSFLAGAKKFCRYLDMPIQHFSTDVLRKMNRRVTQEQIHHKITRLRTFIPEITLRTSVIVGFPGETEEDFQKLLAGIQHHRFDHLGVFKYSDEEGTAAYRLGDKVPVEIIEERFNQVYEVQKEIVREKNKALVGKTLEVLVEGPHPETPLLLQGRHQGQAPDIDGKVIIRDTLEREVKAGDFISVKIEEVFDYDLVGSLHA